MLRRKFVQLMATIGAGSVVSAAAASKATASRTSARQSVRFHVKGFSCITCAVGLDTMLKQRKGVASSHSTYPEGIVVVQYDASEVTEAQLRSIISEMGFTVE